MRETARQSHERMKREHYIPTITFPTDATENVFCAEMSTEFAVCMEEMSTFIDDVESLDATTSKFTTASSTLEPET